METGSHLPKVDSRRCTLCGLCVEVCPCRAAEMVEGKIVFKCPAECRANRDCPHDGDCWCVCEDVCPAGAIECPFEIVFEG